MKRFLIAIIIFLLMILGACDYSDGPLDPMLGTFVAQTQTVAVWTLTPHPIQIIPTQIIQDAFSEVDRQLQNILVSNFAFNKPDNMEQDETASMELILNPSLSKPALATQLVDQGGFITSTADPNVLIAPSGESNTIETGQTEITPRMKAVLLSQDPDAFIIQEMHDNAEQVVSSTHTTTWHWSVTAKKEGLQTLELSIYQLIKYDGREFWYERKTYQAHVLVEVTVSNWINSLDWKWLASAMLIPLVVAAWSWFRNRKKKEDKPVQTPKKSKKKQA